jgi:transcriptional regulator with XRE-family HTH domain
MAQSTLRTTVAVLRKLLALSVEQFASLAGKSVPTIQSIEAGKRLKLTKETAQKIAFETGVSLDWLLAGDVTVEPYSSLKDPTGRAIPYSRTVFELIQSGKFKNVPKHSLESIQFGAILMTAEWFPIFASAVNRGEGDLAAFVMDDHLKEMRKRFGYDDKAAEQLSGKAKFTSADGHTFAFVYKG